MCDFKTPDWAWLLASVIFIGTCILVATVCCNSGKDYKLPGIQKIATEQLPMPKEADE